MFRINDVPGNGGFLDEGGGLRYNRARMRYYAPGFGAVMITYREIIP